MKGYMLICVSLCLLLCWMPPIDSMKFPFGLFQKKPIIMSMEEESVDDVYLGCSERMMNMVMKNDLKMERKMKPFTDVWRKAEQCAIETLRRREKSDMALTKYHMQAICAYTCDGIYSEFNKAVRTNKNIYGSTFHFHSLHFWLTSAIQILNSNQLCHTTYRRTKLRFGGEVGKIIRLGSFASSSYRTDLKHFGKKTCFKIKTCAGAYLKKYSYYKDQEQEVLIPPYEKFKIIGNPKSKSVAGLSDCKTVYVLESAGIDSNLNCKAARK